MKTVSWSRAGRSTHDRSPQCSAPHPRRCLADLHAWKSKQSDCEGKTIAYCCESNTPPFDVLRPTRTVWHVLLLLPPGAFSVFSEDAELGQFSQNSCVRGKLRVAPD